MVRGVDPRLERDDTVRRPRSPARLGAATLAALLQLLGGCEAQLRELGPEFPAEPPATGYARAAFLARVDLRTHRVTITAPGPTDSLPGASSRVGDRPAFSLVGGDAVLLTTSNFSASPVGAFLPGKVRVTFDIAVTNRLNLVELVGPTDFPAPPPGTTGPLLFPYDIAVATTSGGVSGNGGNDIIVILPSAGLVAPSTDWDGAPYNFFNDTSCGGGNDCYRWEEFVGPVAAGTTSASRRVGFDIDATVGQFTARIILAADVQNVVSNQPGSVQGSINSPTLGPLGGVTVLSRVTGTTAVSDFAGSFSLTGLPPGMDTLTLSGVPAFCIVPAPQPVTILPGAVTSITLNLTCSPPALVGSITGSITLSVGGAAAGVGVLVTPSGLPAEPTVVSDALGSYTVNGVDVGDGTGVLELSGLPSGCSGPLSIPYTGLTNGGTLVRDIVLNCP